MRRVLVVAAVVSALVTASWQSASQGSRNNVHFTDITDIAGITFKHTAAPEKKYIVESMSGGVALWDYDNDGFLDIYFTNSLTVETADTPRSSRSALYHNSGNGTFTDVTEKSGLGYPGWAMGAVAADFDADGFQDLYVTCLGSNHLYRNNRNGTFSDITAAAAVNDPRWSTGAAFGDYDNDGALDLFVANYVDFKLSELPTFGKGKFCVYHGIPVQCGPRGLPGAGDSLFRNNGKGAFTDVSREAGVADLQGRYGLTAIWTDVDQDGWADLYVANDGGPNFLYHNKGNRTFEEVGFPAGVAVGEDGQEQGSMGVAFGDSYHDGRFAISVTNFSDEYNALYRPEGRLTYADVSLSSRMAPPTFPLVGWGTAFIDYDNDGWLDLLAVNGHVYPQVDQAQAGTSYAQRILLFRNRRNGTFAEIAGQAGDVLMVPRVSRGAAFGDIDNDGDVDVVINNLDGKPTVLRNDGGNRNHWITLRLVGNGLNRDALGARVQVAAGDLIQWDEVRSSGSYLSSGDLRLHFGLEENEYVDLIEVHWPDGKTESIAGISADQFLTVEEGIGNAEKR